MQVAYSEYILWGRDPEQNIAALRTHDPDGVELFLEGPGWEDDAAVFDRVAASLEGWGGSLSIHPPSWDINLASPTRAVRRLALEESMRTIELAARLHGEFVVIHTGWYGEKSFPHSRSQVLVQQGIAELLPFARERGVRLGIENVGWFGADVFSADEYIDLVRGFGDGAFALVDVGHAHLQGWDPAAVIHRLGHRVGALHLHSNHGQADEHLPVGQGTMDWPAIWAAVRTVPPTCRLVLEYKPGTPLALLRTGYQELLAQVGDLHDG